jgi:hypothetical protein
MFGPENQPAAEQLLVEECGTNLPLLENSDMYQLERFRYAALKLSRGNLRELEKAIALAKTDWRDLLMAAGFGGDITAHQRWLPTDPAE